MCEVIVDSMKAMALSEHNVDLNCPICLELLSDPKELSCSHTFCEICLGHIYACSPGAHSSQNISNDLKCLICKKKTPVKDGNVRNLKTNESLKSRTDSVRDSQHLCEMCDSKFTSAIHFCSECGKYMCNACLKNHNKWPENLKHEVVSVADIRVGRAVLKKKVFCREHKYVCTDLCITCKKPICMRCTIDHKGKGHDVQHVDEYNASVKETFESLQDQAKTKTATIKSHVTYIVSQKKNISDHIDGKKTEINKVYQESIKKLEERKAALDKQLEDQKVELHDELDNMIDSDVKMIASIESASSLVGSSLKAPLGSSIVDIHDAVSGELQILLDKPDPEKELASDVANHAEQLVFRPNDQGDPLNIGEVGKWEFKCNVRLSDKGTKPINAMTSTPNGKMALAYDGGIDFFSADGQLQETVLKDTNVHGGAFLSDGSFAVNRLRSGMSVYTLVYTQDKKTSARFETGTEVGFFKRPTESPLRSLAVDSSDEIYVCNKEVGKIQVFSPAGGEAIREIPCDEVPSQIACYDDTLLINDIDTIRVIDKAGNTKYTMQKPNSFPYAAVTMVTQRKSILIAWVKHDDGLVSIDEYTKELKHIQTLISDHKIEKPDRAWYYLQEFRSGEIAFCTPDRLYIFGFDINPIYMAKEDQDAENSP